VCRRAPHARGAGAAGPAFVRCLSHDSCAALTSAALRVARHLDAPQDIEWTVRGNDVVLLQTRPITASATTDPVVNGESSGTTATSRRVSTHHQSPVVLLRGGVYETVHRTHCA